MAIDDSQIITLQLPRPSECRKPREKSRHSTAVWGFGSLAIASETRVNALLARAGNDADFRGLCGTARSAGPEIYVAGAYRSGLRPNGSHITGESGMAERVGFEPTIRFPVYTLSKRAP
jgi:hypothetical protein